VEPGTPPPQSGITLLCIPKQTEWRRSSLINSYFNHSGNMPCMVLSYYNIVKNFIFFQTEQSDAVVWLGALGDKNPLARVSNVKPTFFKDRLLSFSH
jgi:hypothetical protein